MEQRKKDRPTVAVALSGGVDSAVAALLLQRMGYAPHGVTFRMTDAGEDPVPGARAVAEAVGIPHTAVDARADFARTVLQNFQSEYENGRTPNPCVLCNRAIKFPLLARFGAEIGADFLATGHYARVVQRGERYAVARAKDEGKDQSYMLWGLPQALLSQLVFPLGAYTKEEIRALAEEAGLPAARKKDSQDICFIPDGDYLAYLERAGVPLPPSLFTDTKGVPLGEAKNHAAYTVGQRKGLGIALGRPMYVVEKSPKAGTVTLSAEDPHVIRLAVTGVNGQALPASALTAGGTFTAKLRYTKAEHPCTAVLCGETLTVTLSAPARAPAPGQSLVLYDGEAVVAGGLIESYERI